MDLKDGQVVHAVAGRRNEYRPIRSVLCDDASPRSVASALESRGAREVYVADLNAIEHGQPDWSGLRAVIDLNLTIYLDAGLGRLDAARRMQRYVHTLGSPGTVKFVLALEAIHEPSELALITDLIGLDNCTFSLDLLDGRMMTPNVQWKRLSPPDLAARIVSELGVRSFIVLDLAHVGTGDGGARPVLDICRQLRDEFPHLELLSGGGVKDMDDVQQFWRAGCSAVLVGTAIHRGDIGCSASNSEER
jgi:phosphoribosylformimino-5-aminoimidazole carboxamide ribotide isomerase